MSQTQLLRPKFKSCLLQWISGCGSMHSSANQLLHWFVLAKRNPKVFKNQPLNVRIQCQRISKGKMLTLISLELLLSLYLIAASFFHQSHSILEEWSARLCCCGFPVPQKVHSRAMSWMTSMWAVPHPRACHPLPPWSPHWARQPFSAHGL